VRQTARKTAQLIVQSSTGGQGESLEEELKPNIKALTEKRLRKFNVCGSRVMDVYQVRHVEVGDRSKSALLQRAQREGEDLVELGEYLFEV